MLKEYNLPSEEIIHGIQNKETKAILIDKTSKAVEKGVFGSPTFFVENEIFFGKDRLEEVESEIKKRALFFISLSTSSSRSLPKNISFSTKNVGDPKTPFSTALEVLSISIAFVSLF